MCVLLDTETLKVINKSYLYFVPYFLIIANFIRSYFFSKI
jgi:hypothetical protein